MILLECIYARITNKEHLYSKNPKLGRENRLNHPYLAGDNGGVNETLPHPPKPRGAAPNITGVTPGGLRQGGYTPVKKGAYYI